MGSMLRLIDGVLYEGREADEFELTVHKLGNGHAEASIRRSVWWSEFREATPDELEVWRRDREEGADERREANRTGRLPHPPLPRKTHSGETR